MTDGRICQVIYKKECAIGIFSRRGAVASATIYHCAECASLQALLACGGSPKRHTTSPPQCDNICYAIGDSIGISYCITNKTPPTFGSALHFLSFSDLFYDCLVYYLIHDLIIQNTVFDVLFAVLLLEGLAGLCAILVCQFLQAALTASFSCIKCT